MSAVIGVASLFISDLNWMMRVAIFFLVVALAVVGARHWAIVEKRFTAADQWIRTGLRFGPLVGVLVCASLVLLGSGIYSVVRHGTAAAARPDRAPARRLQWSFATDHAVDVGPVVANGTVYAGSIDEIYALDAANGHRRWSYQTAVWDGEGPAVGDGSLYIGCTGKLCAINTATGLLRWTAVAGCPLFSTPQVAGTTVYVGCSDHKEYALAAATGRVRWVYRAAGSALATPQLMDGDVYVASGSGAVDCLTAATGKLRWSRPVKGLSRIAAARGVVYASSFDSTVTALSGVTGDRLWRFAADGPVQASPAVAASTVYFGSPDHLYAVNTQTGRSRWATAVGYDVESSPAVADDTVFVASGDELYALDAADGRILWSFIVGTINIDDDNNPVIDGSQVVVGADGVDALNIRREPVRQRPVS